MCKDCEFVWMSVSNCCKEEADSVLEIMGECRIDYLGMLKVLRELACEASDKTLLSV